MSLDVLKAIVEAVELGRAGVVATVLRHKGSAPGKEHHKMLVFADGSIVGTIGGGKMEADVLSAATKALEDGHGATLDLLITEAVVVPVDLIQAQLQLVIDGLLSAHHACFAEVLRLGFRIINIDVGENQLPICFGPGHGMIASVRTPRFSIMPNVLPRGILEKPRQSILFSNWRGCFPSNLHRHFGDRMHINFSFTGFVDPKTDKPLTFSYLRQINLLFAKWVNIAPPINCRAGRHV